MRYFRTGAKLAAALARTLVYAVLSLSVLAVLAIVVLPRISGIRFAAVLSGSMQPEVATGDLIVAWPVDPTQIELGDVILFRSPSDPGAKVAHRVVEIDADGSSLAFVTKGDANQSRDRLPVPAGRVLGRVQFHLPLLGHVIRQMNEPLMFLLALGVPGAFIIAGEMWNIVRALKGDRSREPGIDLTRGHASEAPERPPVPARAMAGRFWFHAALLRHVIRQITRLMALLIVLAVPVTFIIAGAAWGIVRALKPDNSRELGAEPGSDQ